MTVFDLWLAILLAAVFVFVVSSVVHMALPIHKSDQQPLPAEDEILALMHSKGVRRGFYRFPYCSSMAEFGSDEMKAKLERGPVGTVVVQAGYNMGPALIQWFVYSLVISLVVGYLASMAFAPGAEGVFRFTATAAFLGYGFGSVSESIWKGLPWGVSMKFVFDGLLYGLATGAAFHWMWPAAA